MKITGLKKLESTKNQSLTTLLKPKNKSQTKIVKMMSSQAVLSIKKCFLIVFDKMILNALNKNKILLFMFKIEWNCFDVVFSS